MMKKILILLVCLLLLSLTACEQPSGKIEVVNQPDNTSEAVQQETSPEPSIIPEATDSPTDTLPTAAPSPTIAQPTPTPTPPPPPSGPTMYDSDALFVSFDPSTGIAAFDYIDVLQGDDAIQYMVDYEGKTLQDAQDIVDDWADSEAIIKNHNPQLRMIDMHDPAITMLWYPNGDEDYSLNGVSFSYQDFVTLYTNHPDKVDWYLFYHIDVDSAGNVVEVEQVYWP